MSIYGIPIPIELVNTLRLVIALIVLDAVLGIVLAVKEKKFDWEKLPQFIASNIFPYVGGILAIGMAAIIAGGKDVPELFYAVGAVASAGFLKSCKDKAMALFSGNSTGKASNGTDKASS